MTSSKTSQIAAAIKADPKHRTKNRQERRRMAKSLRLGGAGYTSKGGHTHKYVPRPEDIRTR